MSDDFWNKSITSTPKPKKKLGRPRKDNRKILSGFSISFVLGCQWKALPRCYGAPSTVHDRFQEWQRYQAYLRKCGKLVYWSTIIKKD
jgi:putative transposase